MPVSKSRKKTEEWDWEAWFSSHDVRACSLAAQGLWFNMLGVMRDSPVPGALLSKNRTKVDSKTLAKIIGKSTDEVDGLIKELETNSVFSRLPDSTIINRRVYKKHLISEMRKKAGQKGGDARWLFPGKPIAKKEEDGAGKTVAKFCNTPPIPPLTLPSDGSINITDQDIESLQERRIYLDHRKWVWAGITERDKQLWKAAFPKVDIDAALNQAALWCQRMWRSGKGQKRNWESFLARWFARDQEAIQAGRRGSDGVQQGGRFYSKDKFVV